MYLTALFAPSGLLIARPGFTPALHIPVTAAEITRIFLAPGLELKLFSLLLAFHCPAAFLPFPNSRIHFKKPPAQDTLLSLKQFKLSHETSLTERQKCGIRARLTPGGTDSSNQKIKPKNGYTGGRPHRPDWYTFKPAIPRARCTQKRELPPFGGQVGMTLPLCRRR